MPRWMASATSSRGVQCVTGRPPSPGGSHATAMICASCSAVKWAVPRVVARPPTARGGLSLWLRDPSDPAETVACAAQIFDDVLCQLTLRSQESEEDHLIQAIQGVPGLPPVRTDLVWWDAREVQQRSLLRLVELGSVRARAGLSVLLALPSGDVRSTALRHLSPHAANDVTAGLRAMAWRGIEGRTPFVGRLREFLARAGCQTEVGAFERVLTGDTNAADEVRDVHRPALSEALHRVVKEGQRAPRG